MLKVKNISFQYSNQKQTLKNISFNLNKGEHLCMMGESGCGKSTLLKIIYGLLDVNEGTIFWNQERILGPAFHLVPGIDFFKYVAQDFDLMPYTTVGENIAKFLSRFHLEETNKRIEELLEVIEMREFIDVKVKNLSGGQQQRVAIARALAKEPVLLLLDEPFSQIDNFKKNSLRRKLFNYLKKKDIACITATHDGDDALSFGDKIMIIKSHTIIEYDTPINLYRKGRKKHVCSLFDDINEITINNKKLLVYPHQLQVDDKGTIEAYVLKSYFKGSHWLVESIFNGQPLFFENLYHIEEKKTVLLKLQNCYD